MAKTTRYSILSLRQRLQPHPDFTGKGVTIAFIDSGFYPHPELKGRVLKFVDVTSEKFSDKDFEKIRASSWHGTMIASAVCGSGAWSKGFYRGIAPGAKLVLIKAFDSKKIRSSYILKSLQWVAEQHEAYGIKVVNISLGGDRNEAFQQSKICKTILALHRLGITVVAAAGNSPHKPIVPPGSCPHAITVGGINDNNSLDQSLGMEYGSSYGYTLDGHIKPEIVAPARLLPAPMIPDNPIFEESLVLHKLLKVPKKKLIPELKRVMRKTHLDKAVLKLTPDAVRAAIEARIAAEKFFAPYYQHVDGTSFAAPIVTAIIAQMLEANPELTPTMIRMIIETTARRVGGIRPEKQGYGIINARACVERAMAEKPLFQIEESPLILKDRIVFYYHNHEAKKVTVVGDFTAWRKNAVLLRDIRPGVWRADIPLLSEGFYHYKFLIDEETWAEDPLNPKKEADNFNGMNSVIIVKKPSA